MNAVKYKTPPHIRFELTGQLQDIFYDWPHILSQCKKAITENKKYVVLPVMEKQDTKRNKAKLVKEKGSPLGMVVKNDNYILSKYFPYAPARFNAEDLVLFAAKKFNATTENKE